MDIRVYVSRRSRNDGSLSSLMNYNIGSVPLLYPNDDVHFSGNNIHCHQTRDAHDH